MAVRLVHDPDRPIPGEPSGRWHNLRDWIEATDDLDPLLGHEVRWLAMKDDGTLDRLRVNEFVAAFFAFERALDARNAAVREWPDEEAAWIEIVGDVRAGVTATLDRVLTEAPSAKLRLV